MSEENKFLSIIEKLEYHNIFFTGVDSQGLIMLENSFGKRMRHNPTTWFIYPIEEVVNMIRTSLDTNIRVKE